MIGRRIAIYGSTGSGKSTVAREIGERLDLPVIELDALFHRPNWEPTPVAEFRAKVQGVLEEHRDGWIADGNYSVVRDLILPRADTVIWLRLPFRVVFWRLFKRTVTRAWTREDLWGTNRESWRRSFLSGDSILLWCINHQRAQARAIAIDLKRIPHRASVMSIRSGRQADSFLAALDAKKG